MNLTNIVKRGWNSLAKNWKNTAIVSLTIPIIATSTIGYAMNFGAQLKRDQEIQRILTLYNQLVELNFRTDFDDTLNARISINYLLNSDSYQDRINEIARLRKEVNVEVYKLKTRIDHTTGIELEQGLRQMNLFTPVKERSTDPNREKDDDYDIFGEVYDDFDHTQGENIYLEQLTDAFYKEHKGKTVSVGNNYTINISQLNEKDVEPIGEEISVTGVGLTMKYAVIDALSRMNDMHATSNYQMFDIMDNGLQVGFLEMTGNCIKDFKLYPQHKKIDVGEDNGERVIVYEVLVTGKPGKIKNIPLNKVTTVKFLIEEPKVRRNLVRKIDKSKLRSSSDFTFSYNLRDKERLGHNPNQEDIIYLDSDKLENGQLDFVHNHFDDEEYLLGLQRDTLNHSVDFQQFKTIPTPQITRKTKTRNQKQVEIQDLGELFDEIFEFYWMRYGEPFGVRLVDLVKDEPQVEQIAGKYTTKKLKKHTKKGIKSLLDRLYIGNKPKSGFTTTADKGKNIIDKMNKDKYESVYVSYDSDYNLGGIMTVETLNYDSQVFEQFKPTIEQKLEDIGFDRTRPVIIVELYTDNDEESHTEHLINRFSQDYQDAIIFSTVITDNKESLRMHERTGERLTQTTIQRPEKYIQDNFNGELTYALYMHDNQKLRKKTSLGRMLRKKAKQEIKAAYKGMKDLARYCRQAVSSQFA